MNLTSPSQVKAWCIENDFHPNKVLGQNFLIDQNALLAIVDAGLGEVGLESAAGETHRGTELAESVPRCVSPAARPKPRVLEIGPGMGVLTEEMLKRGCEVTAIEKDPVLAERLAASLGNPPNLKVIAGDALEVIAAAGRRDRSVASLLDLSSFDAMVSNLPYQAGTRILLDLVLLRAVSSMTVLVQTEVADRLAAKEGSKVRGLAGVWAQLDYDVKIVRKVAASCFWPRPAIGSTVVKLTRHDRNAGLTTEERDMFHRLTKQAFEHRRKQLGSIFKDLIQSTARAEELSNEDWIELAKGLTHADT